MNWVLKALADTLGQVFAKVGFKRALGLIFAGSPILVRWILAAAVLVFVSITFYLWTHMANAGEAFMLTLQEPLFQTAQTYKGLEAFILSEQPTDVERVFSSVQVNPTTIGAMTTLAASADIGAVEKNKRGSIATSGETGLSSADRARGEFLSLKLIVKHDTSAAGAQINDTFLTDDKDGFLFVPSVILAQRHSLDNVTDERFEIDRKTDPDIYDDIIASQKIAGPLCSGFRNLTAFDTRDPQVLKSIDLVPHQSYFITRSGVTRLCELDRNSDNSLQQKYYSDQFPATTLFQDRPYFDPTLRQYGTASPSDLACKFFYCTLPYIDLGGNGFVQSFCHAVPIRKQNDDQSHNKLTDAVVCLDFILASKVDSQIKSQLDKLGGATAKVICNDTSCSPALEKDTLWTILRRTFVGSDNATEDDVALINKTVQQLAARKKLSELYGKIYVLRDAADTSGDLRFTIPIGHTPHQSAPDDRIFVFGRLNVSRYQHLIALLTMAASASLLIAVGSVLLILAAFGLQLREQDRAFSTVDRVMAKVPVAYARLDDEGRLVKFNEALTLLFGFESEETGYGALYGAKWEDLLADEASRKAFEQNKAARKGNNAPDPYVVRVWAAGQKKKRISIEVHADDIPEPRLKSGSLGPSFGILLNGPRDAAPTLEVVKAS